MIEIRRRAKTAIKHFVHLGISSEDISQLSMYIPKKPFGVENAHEFLWAVKSGNFEKVCTMLETNRWLAHVYDDWMQTGLHWAAKRNLASIAELLLKHGAFIDAPDSSGRTPIYVAAHCNKTATVAVFVKANANLYRRSKSGKYPLNVTSNEQITMLLQRL